jgi:bacteriorhodopsin
MAVLNLAPRVNDALEINPPEGDNFLNINGSNWLWTVTAIYVVTFLGVAVHSKFARAGERFFHYLFIIANLVGAIAYFAQASDLGWTLINQANAHEYGLTRQIFFAKYILWTISFPAAILSLGVVAGLSWATIIYQILLAWTWIISFLVSAYTETNYKWGFFTFGLAAEFLLQFSTLTTGLRSAKRVGVARDYTLLTGWLNFLWLIYPLAFGLSDGGNRIGVVGGFVFFGVLDVLLIPVFSAAFIVLSRNWDYSKLNIAFTQYGRVARSEGTFPEKAPAAAPAGGVVGEHAV